MQMMLVQALVVLAAFGAVSAQLSGVINPGTCPQVPVKQSLDVGRYMGTWWVYEQFPFRRGSDCVSATYELRSDGKINVVNKAISVSRLLWFTVKREQDQAIGEAAVVDPAQPGRLNVEFGRPAGNGPANYYIVDTDYDNFVLVFSCSALPPSLSGMPGLAHIQTAWIMTRTQGERPSNLDAIKAKLTNAGVDVSPFFKMNQSPEACRA